MKSIYQETQPHQSDMLPRYASLSAIFPMLFSYSRPLCDLLSLVFRRQLKLTSLQVISSFLKPLSEITVRKVFRIFYNNFLQTTLPISRRSKGCAFETWEERYVDALGMDIPLRVCTRRVGLSKGDKECIIPCVCVCLCLFVCVCVFVCFIWRLII